MYHSTILEQINKSIFANEQNKYWYLDVSLTSFLSHFAATIIELKFLQKFSDKIYWLYPAKVVHECSEVFINSLLSSASFNGHFSILKHLMKYTVKDNEHKFAKQDEDSNINGFIIPPQLSYSNFSEIMFTAFSSCVFENAGIKILDKTSIVKIIDTDKLFTMENFSKGVLSGIGSIFGESMYHIIIDSTSYIEINIYSSLTDFAFNFRDASYTVIGINPEIEENPEL